MPTFGFDANDPTYIRGFEDGQREAKQQERVVKENLAKALERLLDLISGPEHHLREELAVFPLRTGNTAIERAIEAYKQAGL